MNLNNSQKFNNMNFPNNNNMFNMNNNMNNMNMMNNGMNMMNNNMNMMNNGMNIMNNNMNMMNNGMNMMNNNMMNNGMNMNLMNNGMNMNMMNNMNMIPNNGMNMMGNNMMNVGGVNMMNNMNMMNMMNNMMNGMINIINNMANSGNNINMNNNNNNQAPDDLIKRGDRSEFVDPYPEQSNSDKINIVMAASTGLRMAMSTPKKTPIRVHIRKYLEKDHLGEWALSEKGGLIFLLNATKVNVNSDEPIDSICKGNAPIITVIDAKNLIAARK